MPIYEYRCGACGHQHDALQKLSDPPLTDCPECGAEALKKLISAPVFRLKGGGWYETDFKSDKEKRRNLADGPGKESSANGSGSDAPKSDGKPAADKAGTSDGVAKKADKSGGSATKASGTKGAGTAAA